MKPKLEAVYPVLMSRDIQRSIAFYQKIGFLLIFQDDKTDPKYIGVKRDEVILHLQWHDSGEWNYPQTGRSVSYAHSPNQPDRPTYRFLVHDVDGLHHEFSSLAEKLDMKPVSDTPWGTREFHLRDPDLNGLQFFRGL